MTLAHELSHIALVTHRYQVSFNDRFFFRIRARSSAWTLLAIPEEVAAAAKACSCCELPYKDKLAMLAFPRALQAARVNFRA